MRRLILLICLIGLFVAGGAVEAKIPPPPQGNIYVLDQANVIDPQTEAKIGKLGKALEAKNKAQVVVVTVPSLEGQDLESYALEILRTWGVGEKDKNNGIVILLAMEERKFRIEVGYGLEGNLPDGRGFLRKAPDDGASVPPLPDVQNEARAAHNGQDEGQ